MLHVWEFGPADGRPIVTLHGLKGYGGRWRTIADLLAPDGFRVVAPDLRGTGRSPRTGPWTLEQHADDVLALPIFDDGPVDVVGHSIGATIAVMMAARRAATLRRMVLLDPTIGGPKHVTSRNAEAEVPPPSFASPAEAAASRAAAWPPEAAGEVDTEVREHLQQDADGRWRWQYEVDAAVAGHHEVSRDLPMPTTIPVLVLRATRASIPDAQVLGWRSCGVTVTDIDAGHHIPLERPVETAAAIRTFLTGESA